MGPERSAALYEEVRNLLANDFIHESVYPDWIANPVLVKKPNGKWRTCIDFSNLNDVCPKDCFPLPRNDQLVDGTTGHKLLSFMDSYSGYNQIPMCVPYQDHTSFVMDRGLYCYKVMPFGLKNAGATYQRLVNKMFAKQIEHTMEVYVDDMLVKSKKATDHIAHLDEMFHVLRKYGMKLNSLKCSFSVSSGKFLGFIIHARGIEANPVQVYALKNIKIPSTQREMQSLNGKVAALSRFISKATNKCVSFFEALKKEKGKFKWTDECLAVFLHLLEHLQQPPLLSTLSQGEDLYLAMLTLTISAALVK